MLNIMYRTALFIIVILPGKFLDTPEKVSQLHCFSVLVDQKVFVRMLISYFHMLLLFSFSQLHLQVSFVTVSILFFHDFAHNNPMLTLSATLPSPLQYIPEQLPAPNAFTTCSKNGKEYNDIESHDREKMLSRKMSAIDDTRMNIPETNTIDFDEKFEQKRKALLSSLSDRIHRALSAFVLGNCTDLVLPAFGCGVHGNDPSMVASVFREMLTDQKQFGGRFRTVVFAIPPSRKQNYQAFAAYFQNKETVKRVTMTMGVTIDC